MTIKEIKHREYLKNKKRYQERGRLYYELNKEKIKERSRNYRKLNKSQLKIYFKVYNLLNREKISSIKKAYRETHKEQFRKWQKSYWNKNKTKCKFSGDLSRLRLKQQLVRAYGGRCLCCGENRLQFLTLEHVNHNGSVHRKLFPGGRVYYDLKRRGFPQEGYTILCWNCNCATKYGKVCPHKMSEELTCESVF